MLTSHVIIPKKTIQNESNARLHLQAATQPNLTQLFGGRLGACMVGLGWLVGVWNGGMGGGAWGQAGTGDIRTTFLRDVAIISRLVLLS